MVRFSFSLATLGFALTAFQTSAQECTITSIPDARCPTLTDYEEVEALIFLWIERSTCPDPADPGAATHWDWNADDQDCNFFPRARGRNPLGPRLVRHAFHDAAGISDGFVDLASPSNAGLEASDHVLTLLHTDPTFTFTDGGSISEVLNRADFAAWSYIAALRFTAMRQRGRNDIVPDIPITIGRQPFGGAQLPEEILPSDHSSGQNVEAYFGEFFNFSPQEAATIMGAHSLGGASPAASGFVGPWTRRRDVFDNEYYRAISIGPASTDESCPQGSIVLDPASQCNGWEAREIGRRASRKTQWRHSCNSDGTGCVQLMLHADMGLFKDIDEFICTTADADAGTNGCQNEGQIWGFPDNSICGEFTPTSRIFAVCFNNKPNDNPLKESVDFYAADLTTFIEEFGVVFNRMITEQNPNALETLSASTPLPPDEASPTATPSVSPGDSQAGATVGADCAVEFSDCVDDRSQNPIICNYCASGMCGKKRGDGGVPAFTCVPSDWTPPRGGGGGGGGLLNRPPRGGGGGGGGRPGRPPRNLRSV